MNINRHNYETFFLLYTDNELSGAERRAVDDFVQANPDLQDELVMLQQSVLKPDAVVFSGKEGLMKGELVPSAAQQTLLSLLDGELSPAAATEAAALIGSDAAVEAEWALLQQTKLEADLIQFRDKHLLYRKEPGHVVAFPWLRVAAAAVFVGFALWGGLAYLGKNNQPGQSVVETVQNVPARPLPKVEPPVLIKPTVTANTEDSIIVRPQANRQALVATTLPAIGQQTGAASTAPVKTVKRLAKQKTAGSNLSLVKSNNLPKSHSEIINNINRNENLPAYVTNEKQPSDIHPGKNELGRSKSSDDAANAYASTTAFTDNTEEKNNDRVLFMDEEKIKKTKLGGIFRKVKRVFERSTNTKSDGNNIKVANMEFAIQ